MNRARLLIANAAWAFVGLALVHCGGARDSNAVANGADAEPPEAAPLPPEEAGARAPDAGMGIIRPGPADGGDPSSVPFWKPTVFVLDLRPQPSPIFAPAPNGDPGFTVPTFVVQNERSMPKRGPDVFVDSKKLGGIGFGCIAYDFRTTDPMQPRGPGLTSGDMGPVTMDGYSGGTYVSGPSAEAGIASPTLCTRAEIAPDSGLFGYGCGDDQHPATGFLQKTDTIAATASGGADVSAWALKTRPSSYDDLAIETDLWHVAPDAIDGSKDFTVAFDCGGGPCNTPLTFVRIVVETSDGRDPDAGPAAPLDFPPPTNAFGRIECFDYLPPYGGSYTLDNGLLSAIPATWTDLRITVATFVMARGVVDSHYIAILGAGFGRFGITHR